MFKRKLVLIMFKFIIPCKEANHNCDKTQYKESSFSEKLKLYAHLVYCRACRQYTKNNMKLTKLIDKSEVTCLDRDCKKRMKKEFNAALDKESQ